MTSQSFRPSSSFFRSAAISVALLLLGCVAVAQEVTLRAIDGDLTVDGRIVGYDGTNLRVETDSGTLTLNYARIRCEGQACPVPGRDAPFLRFSGAQRMGEIILPALTEGFARDNGYLTDRIDFDDQTSAYRIFDAEGAPLLNLIFRATTTTDGFADLLADEADVLLANRSLTEPEARLALEIGLGNLGSSRHMQLVALDAMAPVAGAGQSVRDVSLANVARAFGGEITNWSELGGADAPIRLHLPNLRVGASYVFVDTVVERAGLRLSEQVIFHPTIEATAEAVAADRTALSVLPVLLQGNTQPLGLRDACGIASRATQIGIKTEDYPLTLPLYLYHPRRAMPEIALDFFAWMTTAEAQLILRRAGVEAQAPSPITVDQQGRRFAQAIANAGDDVTLAALQRMVRQLDGSARLSLTFRFDEGERELDLTSQLHAEYLAMILQDGAYHGQSLLLVGFGDSEGGAAVNRELSLNRANAVRETVLEHLGGVLPDGVSLRTVGLGETLPIGCDDTPWGRRSNRRVELWIGSAP